jgi:tetratricopeptide (TPR) repeat protein
VLTDRRNWAALLLLAVLSCALYLPFLANPPFFDDQNLFSGHNLAGYALSPLGLGLRLPAYFSLAFVQVVWGSIEAHRLFSLAFHVVAVWALYALIRGLQRYSAPDGAAAGRERALAAGAAALFALHPVAAYAAGYLMQRSIVLATLFGLLSVTLYVRGLRTGRHADAIGAGVLFSLAVLCKEHAILLPAAAAVAAFMRPAQARFALRHTAIYAAVCAPAAVLAVLMAKGVVGERYEPHFGAVVAQLTPEQWAEVAEQPWIGSALAQVALFFRYLGLWLWPRTGAMALDVRIDFAQTWAPAVAVPATIGFLAFAALGGYLLRRGGRAGMAGFGLLYFWILYLLEFSVVRFQEPFVLYRSYLWAPGLAIALAAGLGRLPLRACAAAVAIAALLLSVQTWDRLRSMSSGLALWEDAASKLPVEPIPGGWRTLYGLGREYLRADLPDKAMAVTERCLAQYPGVQQCFFARAAIHLHLEQYDAAIPYILQAIALTPEEGVLRHHLGLALEELGCREQARALYELSYKLHFTGAKFRLQRMDSPGGGLLPPPVVARRARPCAAPPIPASAFQPP